MTEKLLESVEETKDIIEMVETSAISVPKSVDRWLDNVDVKQAASVADRFLDVITTSSGRATHYNSKEEQEKALREIHKSMFEIDRGLYSVLVMLNGATDYSRQIATTTLLDNPVRGINSSFISNRDENFILSSLIRDLPPQRMLKLFCSFADGDKKINNARTRKLILRTILQADVDRLEYWAVKYRQKLRKILRHALSVKRTSILGAIISKGYSSASDKEKLIVHSFVGKYIGKAGSRDLESKLEIINFILGNEKNLTLTKLVAYKQVKEGNWSAGKILPLETMEGLRKQYFPKKNKEDVISLTKDSLTSGQKMAVQKRAKAAGVSVEFDPKNHDAVKLYKYAYEMGFDDDIEEALNQKARKAAQNFPVRFEKVGIIFDNSQSMYGHKTQAFHPISVALSIRDLLHAVSNKVVVRYTSLPDRATKQERRLPNPSGDTSIASHFIDVLEEEPDAVFILSDGYENTSAGRFSEVLKVVRDIGIETPVYQLSPVSAAESSGIKHLAPGLVKPLPVMSPAALGTTIIKAMLTSDPKNGLRYLVGTSLQRIGIEERKGEE